MERDDVHDDGREQRERERREAVREQERAGDRLGRFDQREHVAGGGEGAEELASGPGVRRNRQEAEEAVEAEDEEEQAEQRAGDVGSESA